MNHIYQQPQFGEVWFNYPELYRKMVDKFPSGSKFVEIGSWKGMSASYMAVEIANSGKDIDFYCVDTWEGSVEHKNAQIVPKKLYSIFLENMRPLEKYYKAIRSPSVEAAETFEDKSLDFIFIDASHEYEDVKDDILAWLPKLKDGGVIAGHDYTESDYSNGVQRAVKETLSKVEIIIPVGFMIQVR